MSGLNLPQQPIEVAARYPLAAIGMISAPRPQRTVEHSLAELRRAGFEQTIHVFEEPGTETAGLPGVIVHTNSRRYGIWQNWLAAARFLLDHSAEPYVLLCEDDIALTPDASLGLQHALEHLPPEDWGFVSLYTPWHALIRHRPVFGWQPIGVDHQTWGALAWCFARATLRRICECPAAAADRDGHTDQIVGQLLGDWGYPCYYHIPSLCEHAGQGNSSAGHWNVAEMKAVGFAHERRLYVAATDQIASVPVSAASIAPAQPAGVPAAVPASGTESCGATPLISCIMPTSERREFAEQAVRCFQQQTYPQRELVIVDASRSAPLPIPLDPRIRLVRMPPGTSIGAMRNRACQLARGELIAQWDDDDWYGPDRLRVQAEPLVSGRADITAFCETVFYDALHEQFLTCSPDLHRRMFVLDVQGGTLVYRRAVWERLAQYPKASVAEDAALLHAAVSRGARLARIPAAGHYVYVRHGRNSWCFAPGAHGGSGHWSKAAKPPWSPADRDFFRRLANRLRNESAERDEASGEPQAESVPVSQASEPNASATPSSWWKSAAAPVSAPRQRLAVVSSFFNLANYRRPLENYRRFARHMQETGAELWTIELSFSGDFALPDGPRMLRICGSPTRHALWQKERLLNVLVSHLPPSCDALAWLDADVHFAEPDWVQQTLRLLDTYPVVQLFQEARQELPDQTVASIGTAVAAGFRRADPEFLVAGRYHPGLAWALRREVWERLGGWLDLSPVGGNDGLMCLGFWGRADTQDTRHTPNWRRCKTAWIRRAFCAVQGRVGFRPGVVTHMYHGSRQNRQHCTRWACLTRHGFDPGRDVELDDACLWRWSDEAVRNKSEMLAAVTAYFHGRREDE